MGKLDRHLIMQDEEEHRMSYMLTMKHVFEQADTDKSGTLSWEEFETHLKDKHMASYFAVLGLGIMEAKNLFRLLDLDNSNDVSIGEFLTGCFRLKGDAKQLDLATLMYENKRMIERMTRFMTYVVEEFEHLKSGIIVLNEIVAPKTEPAMDHALWPTAGEGDRTPLPDPAD